MITEEHGGGCCGVTHIFDFRINGAAEELQRNLKTFLEYHYDEAQMDGYETKENLDYDGGWDDDDDAFIKTDKKFSCILEACLTDQQMMFWAPHMKEAGFKVVNRFLNSNSGNVVNILHFNPAGRRKIGKVPYKW